MQSAFVNLSLRKSTNLVLFLFFLLLSSCSSGKRKVQEELRQKVARGDYAQALGFIREHNFFQEENERLLKSLEEAMILHRSGEYRESAEVFEVAKRIVEELYTVSMSQRVQIYLIGDYRDVYYGHPYEHSLVFFYKSLNHFQLAMNATTPRERREELFRARAELVAWDSFIYALESERLGKTVFKRDLLANLWGGIIHEEIGSREDLEIALNLYQNAHEVLLKNYKVYKVFNQQFEIFKKDYDLLPELSIEAVLSDYVEKTTYAKHLSQWISYRQLSLTYRHRGPQAYQRLIRQLKSTPFWSEEIQTRVELEVERFNKDAGQIRVVAQNSMIPAKQGREIFIGLARGLQDPSVSSGLSVAASVLAIFAAEVLGLMPPPNQYNPSGAYFGLMAAEVAVREAAIGFEVAAIDYQETSERLFLVITDFEKKEIERMELALVAPIGDIAAQALAEDASARRWRQGIRVIGKHATALAASYATYQAISRGDDNRKPMARSIALLQYTAASRAIVASERADTRYWSTLPQDIRLESFFFPQGEYHFALEWKKGEQMTRTRDLGVHRLSKEDPLFFNVR